MRYNINSQQLNQLRKEGFVSLEGLLSPIEITTLKSLIDPALERNPTGRDLERDTPELKHAIKLNRFGQIASELFNQKPLKLAFTQLNPNFEPTLSLEEISSVTNVCGLALIPLDESNELITFFTKTAPLDFSRYEKPFLLIAFTGLIPLYKICENDPHTHALKKLGYVSGDQLTEETHPMIAK